MSVILNNICANNCNICHQLSVKSQDNTILTSILCGHKVCIKCLKNCEMESGLSKENKAHIKYNIYPSVNQTNRVSLLDNIRRHCPVCRSNGIASSWIDLQSEESDYEYENLIRQNVFRVYNAGRDDFQSTPLYDNYLENRESLVYTLAYSKDANERQHCREELEVYEIQNQRKIVECNQKQIKKDEECIRDIVEKEGSFYEAVQLCNYPSKSGVKNNMNLVHVLQRTNPQLFDSQHEESDKHYNDSKNLPNTLNSYPKPLNSSLVYATLKAKTNIEKSILYRACGRSKITIFKRVNQELWGGVLFHSMR